MRKHAGPVNRVSASIRDLSTSRNRWKEPACIRWGFGWVDRDIEGWGYSLDANLGKLPVSPSPLADDQGINGGQLTVGPGIGLSASATYTETTTLEECGEAVEYVEEYIVDTLEDIWEEW